MQSLNFIEMWHNMGIPARAVVILLVGMSVYSLWVMIDRFRVFKSAKSHSIAFVLGLRDRLMKRDLGGALALSQASPKSPIAKVIQEALMEYNEGLEALHKKGPADVGEFDIVDAVNRAIDRVKERETAGLKTGLGGLATISSAAPFIGLFGTVVGIINAFASMGASGQGGLATVSAGISEALVTTAIGLLVAIPAVMAFNYFTNSIEAFVVDMNDVSSELITYVLREGRDRA